MIEGKIKLSTEVVPREFPYMVYDPEDHMVILVTAKNGLYYTGTILSAGTCTHPSYRPGVTKTDFADYVYKFLRGSITLTNKDVD